MSLKRAIGILYGTLYSVDAVALTCSVYDLYIIGYVFVDNRNGGRATRRHTNPSTIGLQSTAAPGR